MRSHFMLVCNECGYINNHYLNEETKYICPYCGNTHLNELDLKLEEPVFASKYWDTVYKKGFYNTDYINKQINNFRKKLMKDYSKYDPVKYKKLEEDYLNRTSIEDGTRIPQCPRTSKAYTKKWLENHPADYEITDEDDPFGDIRYWKDVLEKEKEQLANSIFGGKNNAPHMSDYFTKKRAICPACHSSNTEKISVASRVAHGVLFGLFSKTARSQFKCNSCGNKF